MSIEEAETDSFRGTPKPNPPPLGKPKWRWQLLLTAISATFGLAVPVGYNIGSINSPAEHIMNWCNESWTWIHGEDHTLSTTQLQTLWSGVVSIFLIGGCVGSLAGGWCADQYGRKKSLIYCGVIFIGAGFMYYKCGQFQIVYLLLGARFVAGIASGLATSVLPMYLAELAPLEFRGTMAAFTAIGVSAGIVISQIVTLPELLGTENHWEFALSVYIYANIYGLLLLAYLPESPKYLYVIANRRDNARHVLHRLRGNEYNRINRELEELQMETSHQTSSRSIGSVLTDPKLLLPLVIVCALQAGQQLSGINAVAYYSSAIFEQAGLSAANAKWATLFVGCVNLLATVFSSLVMQRCNRRPVILTSCLFTAITLIALTVFIRFNGEHNIFTYASVVAVIVYISAFQIGLGPIPYFIASELFEVPPRPAAMAIGSMTAWFFNFVIGMSFLVIQSLFGGAVFLIFAVTCLLLFGFLYRYLPETMDKQATDIAPMISDGFRSKRQ